MSDESHPDRGSTIAFDTRYDVSTQVDSSAPADKFPEMCGSATLAMEVSNTSINVASVTVIAITQGLIFPFGVRNLARTLFSMAAVLVPTLSTPEPFSLFHVCATLRAAATE